MRRFPLLLALCCLPLVVGCEGCRSDPEQPEDKQVAPVEDFTSREAMAFPADAAFANNAIKPGHWFTASQSLKSNKADARGVLQSTNSMRGSNVEAGTTEVVEGELMTVRPIVLPKGQQRRFDFRLLAPTGGTKDQNRMYVSSRFISSGRTLYHDTGNVPFNVLAGREYFFVVLTGRAERFAKFQVSDWVRPFKDQYAFKQRPPHYRIVFPPTKNLLPLSESMLDWTATAVVCWDDIPPEALTPVQQQALADWLRFGGTLIVNGADASDAIMQTALADVLPLRPTGNIQLDPDAAGELLKRWSVDGDRTTEKQIALLREQEGRVAVDGQKSDDAVEVEGTSNLVLVRRVGLGRVVQARFDITSDWMVTWESYDSFVNAVMLARPRREFSRNFDVSQDSTLKQAFPDYPLASSDPALNSRLRITARDAVLPAESTPRTRSAASSSRLDPLTLADTRSGVCGWTNDSDTLWHCLRILGEESGIEIPDSSLVVRSLGYYLLILVPINYLVFRLVGRLEYAWLAVPLIAIGGAVWVARAARLDIGFARKQTELAVLELQPDYHRGHLTRVIAIYNSLSSSYELQFDSVEAVAVPIADRQASAIPNFKTSFEAGPSLAGLAVESNKTRMVHTEEMIDVGGAIRLDESGRLVNETEFEFLNAVVVRKVGTDQVQIAEVGPCTPGASVALRFRDGSNLAITEQLPMQTGGLLRIFASPAAMHDGSVRFVGRIEGKVPGMTIAPQASQSVAQTIVLAHLQHAAIEKPVADVNLVSKFDPAIGKPEPEDDSQ